jgi:hypothetical protein
MIVKMQKTPKTLQEMGTIYAFFLQFLYDQI